MRWISVNVDIDIADIDLSDLSEAFETKLEYINPATVKRQVSYNQAESIVTNLSSMVLGLETGGIKVDSIVDQSKLDYIRKVFHKYSFDEIVKALPE